MKRIFAYLLWLTLIPGVSLAGQTIGDKHRWFGATSPCTGLDVVIQNTGAVDATLLHRHDEGGGHSHKLREGTVIVAGSEAVGKTELSIVTRVGGSHFSVGTSEHDPGVKLSYSLREVIADTIKDAWNSYSHCEVEVLEAESRREGCTASADIIDNKIVFAVDCDLFEEEIFDEEISQ